MSHINDVTRLYEPIILNMSEGVVFIDAEDRIVICNEAAERIRKIRAAKIVGKNIFSIHPKRMHGRIAQLINTLKSGEADWATRLILSHKRYFSNSYSAIRDSEGNYLGTLMLSKDVTEEQRLRRENENLRNADKRKEQDCVIVCSSAAQKVMELIRVIGPTDSTVLVTGENGVGKECVVDMLHRESPRYGGPLIKLNCAALPENLIESELFGYTKGAFTGATENRKGKFELADGGTLFLDEIGDLPMSVQVKLLRFLQEKVVQPLGGRHEVLVNVRIVAATNHILQEDVAAGRFREDLFYRLNVVNIDVPPLRDRRDDIEPLANSFLKRFSARMKRPLRYLSHEALQIMLQYDWPGNVRQLEHAMERAVILSSGELILADDLPDEIRSVPVDDSEDETASLREAIEHFERRYIAKALQRHGFRKCETARDLGISRKSLWLKVQKYKLEKDIVT
jgi:PAS domain S-box-containing protein